MYLIMAAIYFYKMSSGDTSIQNNVDINNISDLPIQEITQ